MKFLNGSDLVQYISERQSKQVRALVQGRGIKPRLAIISTDPSNLAIQTYIRLKAKRAEELGIILDHHELEQSQCEQKIKELAEDPLTHGIILQLPLKDPAETEHLLSLIPPEKDVDGMSPNSPVPPATAQAVLWLLAGYNIDLKDKRILVIGKGKLVGAPLTKLIEEQGMEVSSLDELSSSNDLSLAIKNADIIITATGSPGLIKKEMLHDSQVIIDCGTSESGGELVGDLDPSVYDSKLNIKVTPKVGGVGPLTISCLFENLLHLIDKNI